MKIIKKISVIDEYNEAGTLYLTKDEFGFHYCEGCVDNKLETYSTKDEALSSLKETLLFYKLEL